MNDPLKGAPACGAVQLTGTKRRGAGFTEVLQGRLGDLIVGIKRVAIEEEIFQVLFRREGRFLSDLDHPSIIRLVIPPHEHLINGVRTGCLVMPWYEETLLDTINRLDDSPIEFRLKKLVLPVAQALAHIHNQQTSHRDIKPQNILMDPDGRPILADFGLGKDLGAVSTNTAGAWSSAGYTPDRPGTPYQQDVYSFGVVALEIFLGHQEPSIFGRNQALNSLEIDHEYREIIRKCLRDDPDNRFASMSEVADTLEAARRRSWVAARKYGLTLHVTRRALQDIEGYDARSSPLRKLSKLLDQSPVTLMTQTADSNQSKFIIRVENLDLLVARELGQLKVLRVTESIQRQYKVSHGRAREFPLTNFPVSWEVTSSQVANRTESPLHEKTWARIEPEFNAWIEAGCPPASFQAMSENSRGQFQTWERLLDAKEQVYRGDGEPIPFSLLEEDGNGLEVHLKVDHEFEMSLEGTFWSIEKNGGTGQLSRARSGEIVAHFGGVVVIAFPFGRPASLPKTGFLVPSVDGGSQLAIQRQREALEALASKTSVNPRLGALISEPHLAHRGSHVEINTWFNDSLDDDKKAAVEMSLGSAELTLVKGPPGTGKTSFISELVLQILKSDESARVLIVSQTHVAIDNVIERLSEADPKLALSRIGNPNSPAMADSSKRFLVDRQIKNWAADLEGKSNRHVIDLAMSLGLPAHHAVGLQSLLKLRELQTELSDQRQQADDEATANEMAAQVDAIERQIKRTRSALADQIEDVRPPQNQEETDELIESLVESLLDPKKFVDTLALQSKWISRLNSSNEMDDLFLKSQNVLAGTCIGFLSQKAVKGLQFDYCILDEASKASATEALVPFARARKVILVGDTAQLGPSNFELEGQEEILSRNGLTRANISETLFSFLEENLPAYSMTSLRTQHRMVNSIGDLVSQCFYDGALESLGPDALSQLTGVEKGIYAPLMWISTSRGQYRESRREQISGTSYFNEAEASEIIDRIRSLGQMRRMGYIHLPVDFKILVIAPYVGQRHFISRQLELVDTDGLNIEVQTIDAVQGREASLVFLSAVRSNASRGSNVGFLNSPQRINVAVSRARQSLVIVGDLDFWRESSSPLTRVIDHFETLPIEVCRMEEDD